MVHPGQVSQGTETKGNRVGDLTSMDSVIEETVNLNIGVRFVGNMGMARILASTIERDTRKEDKTEGKTERERLQGVANLGVKNNSPVG